MVNIWCGEEFFDSCGCHLAPLKASERNCKKIGSNKTLMTISRKLNMIGALFRLSFVSHLARENKNFSNILLSVRVDTNFSCQYLVIVSGIAPSSFLLCSLSLLSSVKTKHLEKLGRRKLFLMLIKVTINFSVLINFLRSTESQSPSQGKIDIEKASRKQT